MLSAAARLASRPAARAFSTKEVANVAPEVTKRVALVAVTKNEAPVTTLPGQAFVGDLRSTSGLGQGDGKVTHTSKWLGGDKVKSPLDLIQASEPIKVHGAVVASYGSADHGLGAPVQYISLKGTSKDNPAVCKYTGNKYYSDDWRHAH